MSEVLSIRISRKLKEAMRKANIDWRMEIELFIKRRLHQYFKEKYLREAKLLRSKIPSAKISNAELIRENREEQ